MIRDPLEKIRRLEHADLQDRARAERAQDKLVQRAGRRAWRKATRRRLWKRWVAFWEGSAKHLATAGKVIGGATIVATGLTGFAATKPGQWIGRQAKRAWSFYADRGVGAPDQPPPTGVPTTAFDFTVTRGRPPDGGSNR